MTMEAFTNVKYTTCLSLLPWYLPVSCCTVVSMYLADCRPMLNSCLATIPYQVWSRDWMLPICLELLWYWLEHWKLGWSRKNADVFAKMFCFPWNLFAGCTPASCYCTGTRYTGFCTSVIFWLWNLDVGVAHVTKLQWIAINYKCNWSSCYCPV